MKKLFITDTGWRIPIKIIAGISSIRMDRTFTVNTTSGILYTIHAGDNFDLTSFDNSRELDEHILEIWLRELG